MSPSPESPGDASPTWSLRGQIALPDDPNLDAFESGNPEVDAYFRSCGWFRGGRASPPTWQFRDDTGATIGYVAAAPKTIKHPKGDALKSLVIYTIGVNLTHQGRRNPYTLSDTWAASMLSWLEEQARDAGCRSVSLWVREDNAKAIAFYRKNGFEADPDGPVARDGGARHLTMYLVLTPAQSNGGSS